MRGLSIGSMEKTTSRKLARARLLERQQAVAAAEKRVSGPTLVT